MHLHVNDNNKQNPHNPLHMSLTIDRNNDEQEMIQWLAYIFME